MGEEWKVKQGKEGRYREMQDNVTKKHGNTMYNQELHVMNVQQNVLQCSRRQ